MRRIAQRLRTGIASVHVHAHKTSDGILTRLVARQDGVQIKIEINPVMRGSVYDPVVVLSKDHTVDPLSLIAQFRNDADERVAEARDDLKQGIEW
jgi:hypothetical protein